jgi:hypothetical protein
MLTSSTRCVSYQPVVSSTASAAVTAITAEAALGAYSSNFLFAPDIGSV